MSPASRDGSVHSAHGSTSVMPRQRDCAEIAAAPVPRRDGRRDAVRLQAAADEADEARRAEQVRAGHEGGLVEGDAADRRADQIPHAGFELQPVVRRVAQHGRILCRAVAPELVVGVDAPRVVQPVAGSVLESDVHQGGAGHLIAADGRAGGGSGEAVSAGLHLLHHGEVAGKVGAAPRRRRFGKSVGGPVDRDRRRRRKRPGYRCAHARGSARCHHDGHRGQDSGRSRTTAGHGRIRSPTGWRAPE